MTLNLNWQLHMNEQILKIISINHLTSHTYILRLERNNILFKSGQHICLGIESYPYFREYSVYSSEKDAFIEVLIKEVEDGDISKKLKHLQAGQNVRFKGPQGSFMDNASTVSNPVFIATGTGISPFHSFVKTYPQSNYLLIHGVRNINEAYESNFYKPNKYILCTSRDAEGHFNGRVTNYLQPIELPMNTSFYLCGNGAMIYEVFDLLQKKGVDAHNIFYEIYF